MDEFSFFYLISGTIPATNGSNSQVSFTAVKYTFGGT